MIQFSLMFDLKVASKQKGQKHRHTHYALLIQKSLCLRKKPALSVMKKFDVRNDSSTKHSNADRVTRTQILFDDVMILGLA